MKIGTAPGLHPYEIDRAFRYAAWISKHGTRAERSGRAEIAMADCTPRHIVEAALDQQEALRQATRSFSPDDPAWCAAMTERAVAELMPNLRNEVEWDRIIGTRVASETVPKK